MSTHDVCKLVKQVLACFSKHSLRKAEVVCVCVCVCVCGGQEKALAHGINMIKACDTTISLLTASVHAALAKLLNCLNK